MKFWEYSTEYNDKFGIRLSSNWSNKSILRKETGKKTLFLATGLPAETIISMMKTGLDIGTNYLEDCMIASGKKWISKNPGIPKRGEIF